MFLETYHELHGSAHDIASQLVDQKHQQNIAQQQQQAAAQQQCADQGHELGMSAVSGAQQQQQPQNGNQGGE